MRKSVQAFCRVAIILLVTLSGCSAQESNSLNRPGAETVQSTEEMKGAELLWQAPGEAITKYHLYYGRDPQNLDSHLEIPVEELEKIDHKTYGPVFRYYLAEEIDPESLYISLAAQNDFGRSAPTPVVKWEPTQNVLIGVETKKETTK